MLSGHGEIITEEEMDGGDVPARMNDVQPVELRVFIRNAVLFQCLLHVQRSAQSLPNVTASMLIEFQVAVQYLSDCLFGRHLQNGAVIVDHVDDAYPSGLFGEAAYDILRILPPLHLAFGINMQVLSCRTVKFTSTSLEVHTDSWLTTIGIEPVCDIRACGLDERCGQCI
jgi:hypothetical protein